MIWDIEREVEEACIGSSIVCRVVTMQMSDCFACMKQVQNGFSFYRSLNTVEVWHRILGGMGIIDAELSRETTDK
jgi:hypothetical protein